MEFKPPYFAGKIEEEGQEYIVIGAKPNGFFARIPYWEGKQGEPFMEAACFLVNAANWHGELLRACKAAKAVLSGEAVDDVEPGAPSGAALNMLAAIIRKVEE